MNWTFVRSVILVITLSAIALTATAGVRPI